MSLKMSDDTEVIVTGVALSRRRRQLRKTTESYGFLSPTIILLFVPVSYTHLTLPTKA